MTTTTSHWKAVLPTLAVEPQLEATIHRCANSGPTSSMTSRSTTSGLTNRQEQYKQQRSKQLQTPPSLESNRERAPFMEQDDDQIDNNRGVPARLQETQLAAPNRTATTSEPQPSNQLGTDWQRC